MKAYNPVVYILLSAVVLYGIHRMAFLFFDNLQVNKPIYVLEELYLFFTACSIFILLLLVKISKKSFDNVGMVFLIATSVKMVLCYIVLRPILTTTAENIRIEKINFFVMFILFLAIETVIAIRILNNKQ